jgi:hypothetical protein
VRDSIAQKVAVEFYEQLKQSREVSPARLFQQIRRKAYVEGEGKGQDTYAAYCFYGDPDAMARVQSMEVRE